MFKAIFRKEFKKLWLYTLTLLLVSLGTVFYFGFNLNFSFSTVEPESMMWYKFANLEDKPHFILFPLYLIAAVVIALSQFLPEKVGKRIKILAHLPNNIHKTVFLHTAVGLTILLTLLSVVSTLIFLIVSSYYPEVITSVVLKDLFFWSVTASIVYLGLSAVVVESSVKALLAKLFTLLVLVLLLYKQEFGAIDLFWGFLIVWLFFLTVDSFKSIKNHRCNSVAYLFSGALLTLFILFNIYSSFISSYNKDFSKFYIFYSPIIEKFVYQKNFGDHHFEYGIKGERTFDRKEYESYLPFVYWKNLDIMKKLPVEVGGKSFDKKTIKASRLGFSYNPEMLKEREVKLYPLFNPSSKRGVILFPEEAFTPGSDALKFYDFDSGFDNKSYNKKINVALKEQGFTHPAAGVWGKTTNLKPFDWGYLLKSSNREFFSLELDDDTITVKKRAIKKDLIFAKISENRQKILSGFAIDREGSFYLLKYPTFDLIKLELPNFDYRKMRLQLISNPLYYLIRYTDKERYYAVVFDKEFKKLAYEEYE